MIRSMTGFAEKKYNGKTLSVKFSIKSLNHRFLDWNAHGNQIWEIEDRFRVICQRKINRGRVEVHMDLVFMDMERWEVWINEELLQKIINAFNKLSSRLDSQPKFSVENLFALPHVAEMKRKDLTKGEIDFLEKSFEDTLEGLIKVKNREGQTLRKKISENLRNIRAAVRELQKMSKSQPMLLLDKLKERMMKLSQEKALTEDRIVEEAAILAQRFDITEEIVRLESHCEYFQELLSPKVNEPVGKKMDFVAQELFREANTINSKAQDTAVVRKCLYIKSEIEKIRQQVQNIE